MEKIMIVLHLPCPEVPTNLKLREVPNFTFIPIDAELSNLACKFAAENKLRSCDAIYVAVSCMFNSRLITLDDKQRERASNVIEALTPMEELERF